MRIDEIVDAAPKVNGLVGHVLFGLQIGVEYALEVREERYSGTFYGIQDGRFILRSAEVRSGQDRQHKDQVEISLGLRPRMYPI